MTGYGTAAASIPSGRVSVEIRSVNQRFLDVRVTAPREYAPWEAECRDLVRKQIARGRVEVYIGRNALPTGRSKVVLNAQAAHDYATAWRKLKHELGLDGKLDLGLFRPADVFQTIEIPGDARREFPAARRALLDALVRLERERRREGANLQRDMRSRIMRLMAIERSIREHAAAALSDAQARLTERMQRLLKNTEIDAMRITQEAALLAERGDVMEEMVRLVSHLSALQRSLASRAPAGKQIEFLLQEVHREINTIGSKVNNLEVTQLVIEAKGEVERLREQVQNVE
jgi:uncharacterized protein (TIGR00255 family)